MDIIFDSLSNSLLDATPILTQSPLNWLYDSTIGAAGEWVQDSLMNALTFIASLLLYVPYFLTKWGVAGLNSASTINTSHDILQSGWQISMYFVNILAIFFLIILAFANSLRLNIETYEIKKTLPALIAGFVIANLSFLIISILLDVSDLAVNVFNSGFSADCPLACQLAEFTTGMPAKISENGYPILTDNPIEELLETVALFAVMLGISAAFGPAAPAVFIIMLLLGAFLLILPAILILILCLIAIARYIILFILITIAPLAIIIYSFPPTRSLGQKWIEQLFLWIFLAPMIYFILYLGAQFGKEQEFIVIGHLFNQIVDTAKAATSIDPADYIPGFEWSDIFYSLVKYVAGLSFLFAAMYLPFQIGGFGQQIINGIRDLGKKVGHYGWEGGGLKERSTKAVKGLKFPQKTPFIGGSTIGELFARGEVAKYRAEKELSAQDRYDRGTEFVRTGDGKNEARNHDKSMQSTMYTQWGKEEFERHLVDDLQKAPDYQKLKDGTNNHSGKLAETAANMFGALQQIIQNPTSGDKAIWAQELMDQYMHKEGLGFDSYMNVKGRANSDHLGTAIETLNEVGVGKKGDDSAIVDIVKIDNKDDAIRHGSGMSGINSNADGIIADKFKKDNKEKEKKGGDKCTNLNQLIQKTYNNFHSEVKSDAEKLAGAHGQLTAAQLRNIMDNIKTDGNIGRIQEIAKKANSAKLNELLSRIKTKDNKIINPDENIYNHQLKETIRKVVEAKENVQNHITNINNITSFSPHDGSNTAEKIIFNQVKNTYDSVKDSSDFEKARIAYSNAVSHDATTGQTIGHDKGVTQFFAAPTSTTFKKEFVPGNVTVIKMIEQKAKPTDIVKELSHQGKLEDLKPYMAMFVQP